ncbi:NADP-dependent oxidoreductase [Secundilactobacillus folii]|uniref:Zinc-binding dehydrogenase n=1 Tax=Secundilactobacillus folii TaxID=2678357 RepID=A0A7X2XWA2_9LACO|nr:NADP-dependent oxidoreductase [Secundilactobacillus folii]MTV81456.1 zinc-binding dehydrogenase [Secundilactobacillus folii]
MKAIVIDRYGSAQELHEAELPVPQIGADEVLVQTKATSVNPIDWRTRSGQAGRSWDFPVVLGWDVAGVITQIGAQVKRFKVGDAVFARPDTSSRGAYAEYVAVKEDKLAFKPDNISFDEAAAIPLAGTTAYQVIVEQLKVGEGDKVLVQGGAGGVGLFAVQIAKSRGAYVATTASAESRDLLLSLGVDEVIDYHQFKVADVLQNFDAVFDTTGAFEDGLAILKPDGLLVTIVGRPTPAQQSGHPAARHWWLHPSGEDLAEVGKLVASGAVKVVIDSKFPLTTEGLRAAHERSESRHAHGKIVITVN